MKSLRILVADDHPLVRQGLKQTLQAQPGWYVVGEAGTGREAVEIAKKFKPDVAVLDISMPELNGLEAARQILAHVPQIEVLILTVHESEDIVAEVLQAGVRGYVVKTDAVNHLVAAVKALSEHKAFLTPDVAHVVLQGYLRTTSSANEPRRSRSGLTPREREIVQFLAEGKSNKEVAVALEISVKTAETHRYNIMHKLEVHSLSDLVRYAVRNNIVMP